MEKIIHTGRFRRVLSAGTIKGDPVKNRAGEQIGKVDEIMLDLLTGRIAYLVMSFGGVLGLRNKLFAVPWEAVQVDEDHKALILDVQKERLQYAPGFNKSNWPDMSEGEWIAELHRFYGTQPVAQEPAAGREEPKTSHGGGTA